MAIVSLNGYKKNKNLTFKRSFLVFDTETILKIEFSKNNSILSDHFLFTLNLKNTNKKNIYITNEEYQKFCKINNFYEN